ncbi:hypothetical protein JB92DRAFT_2176340 [Gautieria morchelliformis]|nr:hypothetical protein JB92DRAFT_2176340 [Gautieria morchelliformis]
MVYQRRRRACFTPIQAQWAAIWKGRLLLSMLAPSIQCTMRPLVMQNLSRLLARIPYADVVLASVLETIILVAPEEWEASVKHWDGGRWKIRQRHYAGWSGMH